MSSEQTMNLSDYHVDSVHVLGILKKDVKVSAQKILAFVLEKGGRYHFPGNDLDPNISKEIRSLGWIIDVGEESFVVEHPRYKPCNIDSLKIPSHILHPTSSKTGPIGNQSMKTLCCPLCGSVQIHAMRDGFSVACIEEHVFHWCGRTETTVLNSVHAFERGVCS